MGSSLANIGNPTWSVVGKALVTLPLFVRSLPPSAAEPSLVSRRSDRWIGLGFELWSRKGAANFLQSPADFSHSKFQLAYAVLQASQPCLKVFDSFLICCHGWSCSWFPSPFSYQMLENTCNFWVKMICLSFMMWGFKYTKRRQPPPTSTTLDKANNRYAVQ